MYCWKYIFWNLIAYRLHMRVSAALNHGRAAFITYGIPCQTPPAWKCEKRWKLWHNPCLCVDLLRAQYFFSCLIWSRIDLSTQMGIRAWLQIRHSKHHQHMIDMSREAWKNERRIRSASIQGLQDPLKHPDVNPSHPSSPMAGSAITAVACISSGICCSRRMSLY